MLSTPEMPLLASYPKGADKAAIFGPEQLTLTYWDLWTLISAQTQCGSDLPALRRLLVDRRLNERFYSSSRQELVEDLIALVTDLDSRLRASNTTVTAILASIPERLLKKEGKKALNNILTDRGSYYPPSEPMLNSPRRILFREAMRGMWKRLPIDPTSIVEAMRPIFLPKKETGYFPKGSTFALSRRLEKAIEKQHSQALRGGEVLNLRAHRYAVNRAVLTLFHEEHHWDDSYGVMGDVGKKCWNELLAVTADDLCMEPAQFLKDLLTFYCWEDYGLTDVKEVATYLQRLSQEEREVAQQILRDIEFRATQGFQKYRAKSAGTLLARIGAPLAPGPLSRSKLGMGC